MRINYVLDCADPHALAEAPHDDEGHWMTVMADPEGNEFCLIVSPEGWWPEL